jgi:hypothetical protein
VVGGVGVGREVIMWNGRNGGLPEIMEEQFQADNVKGS